MISVLLNVSKDESFETTVPNREAAIAFVKEKGHDKIFSEDFYLMNEAGEQWGMNYYYVAFRQVPE